MERKERLKVFAGLRIQPTITVNPNDGALSFSFDARAAGEDIDATLEELLTMPGQIAADRDRRVVLVLDEFQEVVDIDPGLIKLMRSVFQEQPEVAHVYLGSKRHMMRRIFNDENEPFWRSAKQTELGVIAPDIFAPFALAKFTETGKELDPDNLRSALELTRGHPYATQELLYFLWEETPPGGAADPPRWIAHSTRRCDPSTRTSALSGTGSRPPRSAPSRRSPRNSPGARSAATISAATPCRPRPPSRRR